MTDDCPSTEAGEEPDTAAEPKYMSRIANATLLGYQARRPRNARCSG